MLDPLFWLGLSILLVAVSITAVLMAALPAFQELSRAARSAEKLFDTLNRELPPTLEAIRLTSMEITELTDDMTEGVQNVGRVTQQVDEGMTGVRQQAKQAKVTTRSVVAGFKAALDTFVRPSNRRDAAIPPRLPASQVEEFEETQEADREELDGELETESMTVSVERHSEQVSLHVRQNLSTQPAFDLNGLNPETPAPRHHSPQHHFPQDGLTESIDQSPRHHTRSSPLLPSQNGNSHASPSHRSDSSLNLPASIASEKVPQPAETIREQQNP
ncbi:DUF948 domain-containing protein [Leptolyngbya ohadii]|uniref:DUF948 domain-containing protein n=1 Tax=Leptolyngbya ohadii TaxID=1962290 RepID=UPI0019D4471B|nr:DUF948 domain-containing protein [Leptolyngbya ohadii]